MLSPKKVKHRKVFKGRSRGVAYRGSSIAFGDYALKATICGFMSAQQIEAARITINRTMKRGGKVWIRVFPDKPLTSKPAETRMGKGSQTVQNLKTKQSKMTKKSGLKIQCLSNLCTKKSLDNFCKEKCDFINQ